jgi:DNA-directed RNA polymerase subunit F
MRKSNISHPVSSVQLVSFKEHAVVFAKTLKEIDPNSSKKVENELISL